MIFSVTERQAFMRCRQAWDWASYNRQGYSRIVSKPALSTGHLWHATQAEWSLHPEADPLDLCIELAQNELEVIQKAYLERIGAPISDIELEPFLDGVSMVRAMVTNYKRRWGQPLPDGFTMVSPEQTCVIPIPNTEHDCERCQGTGVYDFGGDGTGSSEERCPVCDFDNRYQIPHYLSGTLDGLIADDYGRVFVLERKTYGMRPKIEVLNMQDQFLAYLWILRELKVGVVGGLAYDGAWKRKEPPRGSTLEDLFIRVLLTRNENELDRFTSQLTSLAMEMGNPNTPIYINRRWDGCWDCDFIEPCIAQERGENYLHLLNTYFMARPPEGDTARELKYADATNPV